MDNWLERVMEYCDRTGADRRTVYVSLLADIARRHPALMRGHIDALIAEYPEGAECLRYRSGSEVPGPLVT